MGTSTVHPSPRKHPWNFQASAYENPSVPPDRVLDEILRCAGSENWDAEMAGGAMAACLQVLVGAAAGRRVAGSPQESAAALVEQAERSLIQSGHNSVFAEFALEGLAACASAGRIPRTRNQTDVARVAKSFVGHAWATAVRYAFLRDAARHVGGTRFSSGTEVRRLADELADRTRRRVEAAKLSQGARSGLAKGIVSRALTEIAVHVVGERE